MGVININLVFAVPNIHFFFSNELGMENWCFTRSMPIITEVLCISLVKYSHDSRVILFTHSSWSSYSNCYVVRHIVSLVLIFFVIYLGILFPSVSICVIILLLLDLTFSLKMLRSEGYFHGSAVPMLSVSEHIRLCCMVFSYTIV